MTNHESLHDSEDIDMKAQTNQELISTILDDNRITEDDLKELNELIERMDTDKDIIHQITHNELRVFMEQENLRPDWFRWGNHYHDIIMNDLENENWSSNSELSLRELIRYFQLSISIPNSSYQEPIQHNGNYIITNGTDVINISTASIISLPENISNINLSSVINDNGKLYYSVSLNPEGTNFMTLEGDLFFGELGEGIYISDFRNPIELGGNTYFSATNRNGKNFLITQDGTQTIFEGEELDSIAVNKGLTSFNGYIYFIVSRGGETFLLSQNGESIRPENLAAIYRTQIENRNLLIFGRDLNFNEVTIQVSGESDGEIISGEETINNQREYYMINGRKYFVENRNGYSFLINEDGNINPGGLAYQFNDIDLNNTYEDAGYTLVSVTLRNGEERWYNPWNNDLLDK